MTLVKLSNGFTYPLVGFGTFLLKSESVEECVVAAIKSGYRCFDCAYLYENEKELGKAFKKCFDDNLVKREDLYITSKLWGTFHYEGGVERAINLSLKDLQLDYLDLYLIHSPISFKAGTELWPKDPQTGTIITEVNDICRMWREMEQVARSGKTKYIGLSNFNVSQMSQILAISEIRPVMNQVEISVQWPNRAIIDFCDKNDIAVTGYCTLGHNTNVCKVIENPIVLDIAKKHGKTPAQILLRYCTQRNICVIPKSQSLPRIVENIDCLSFSLTDDDFTMLETIPRERIVAQRDFKDHPHYPFLDE